MARKATPRRSRGPLERAQRQALLTGTPAGMAFAFGELESARRAWGIFREELMGKVHPAARPAGYWLFEAGVPEELRSREAYRRLVAGPPESLDDQIRAHRGLVEARNTFIQSQ
jgi:hypothetical protein